VVGLILSLALAQQPEDVQVCDGPWAEVEEALSVAWVSPLRKTVRGRTWLTLVPTAELRAWAQSEGQGSVGRLLQHMGMRKRSKEPRRRYKVVVFDVRAENLCRPVGDREGGVETSGLASCVESGTRLKEAHDGCGRVSDTQSDATTAVLRARWDDVVRNGFCVLPAERFLAP